MPLTLMLAKVFGLALIVMSIALLTKRAFFAKITRDFLQQDLLRLIVSFLELVAGLFIVIGHNVWSPMPAAVITVIGWAFVLEGASYLLLPEKWTARFVNAVNRPQVFLAGAIVSLIVGIYLADYGFALWPRFR